ncbi:hypothetical protein Bind_3740 (plasmid) [Beijerinckia indica subsp. indica ATCC 9039]|uniref:Uncharacterized protein n=1 Tax=Beijerinckia indica subsp. indica (strain ATCC 9039 / DSM 1715 / NCIMB 8712) TaxID=395963 RepID=B2IL91_BEII9|nr:hypothetical protein Bind_3740 [Beijerinckia indica subsp. indica ATCC 9039]
MELVRIIITIVFVRIVFQRFTSMKRGNTFPPTPFRNSAVAAHFGFRIIAQVYTPFTSGKTRFCVQLQPGRSCNIREELLRPSRRLLRRWL